MKPWLYHIMRIYCRKYWLARRTNREQPIETVVEIETGLSASPERAIDIRAAMRGLSSSGRRVLTLRYLQGYSLKETAKLAGLAELSVDSTSRRAIARLAKRLGPAYSR